MKNYYLGIDQSTQGTKALILDKNGKLIYRCDKSHRQIVNENGWIEHDPEEIYNNVIKVVGEAISKSGINASEIAGVGISNQRETTIAFDKVTGHPIYNAIVWQCARAGAICEEISKNSDANLIYDITGIPLSPYFSAAKMAWILRNVSNAQEIQKSGNLCMSNMDCWLLFKLTNGSSIKTDYSNASRTQLFNIHTLKWDEKLCNIFGVELKCLPEVCDSDSLFGMTDFEGLLPEKIPVHAMMGDSHGALFAHGCTMPGMAKATYGTGSSIMMNTGTDLVLTNAGVSTSIAWKVSGKVNYVLEGNVNYTGAVITWLKDNLHLIDNAEETSELAKKANPTDETYLIPAFSGLGAPYWDAEAKASIIGMTRKTGKEEVVKAALDCITYQISDIISIMKECVPFKFSVLNVDGGPTKNQYLMQRQSDILQIPVKVPQTEECSGMGAVFVAGIASDFYNPGIIQKSEATSTFMPIVSLEKRDMLYAGWKLAVAQVLKK